MNELTAEELTILIEACDSWIEKDMPGQMMGDLFEAVFLNKNADPESKNKYKSERDERLAKQALAKELRREQATILKAKLTMQRRALRVSQEHSEVA